MEKIQMIKMSHIVADKEQPRQEFEPTALRRLADSIKKQGVLTPLALERQGDTFLIIDGERRYRASKLLGLNKVPAVVYDKMSFAERTIKRFNLQETHSNWSNFDKARAILILKEELQLSSQELADMLGLAERTVAGYLSLLNLSKRTIDYSSTKKLPLGYLSALGNLCSLFDTKKEKEEIEKAILEKIESGVILTYKQVSDYASAIRKGDKKIVDKIINDDEYTSKMAIKESGVFYHKKLRYLISQLSYWEKMTKEISGNIELKDTDIEKIDNFIKALQKIK